MLIRDCKKQSFYCSLDPLSPTNTIRLLNQHLCNGKFTYTVTVFTEQVNGELHQDFHKIGTTPYGTQSLH